MTEVHLSAGWAAILVVAVHLVIVISISLRVLMRRRPPGSAAAWLLLVVLLPYIGAVLYLLIGERPLGRKRSKRAREMYEVVRPWLRKLSVDRQNVPLDIFQRWKGTFLLTEHLVEIPALPGNKLTLDHDTDNILKSIISDIENAKHYCLLEFYIWHPGGLADEVANALIAASNRGVACHVLLDSIGSSDFFRSDWLKRLRKENIMVTEALPGNLLRAAFRRIDLRLHRKIVVIDGKVAYTGSMNLVDPRFFKQDAGVGQWVDAMARIQGPAVKVLTALFAWDRAIETGIKIDKLIDQIDKEADESRGNAVIQIVPSGPDFDNNSTLELLLNAIYNAREELILTTPYFVPDESLVIALGSAARRGVRVRLIVPRKVDSFLVRHASRSFYSDLLEAGVEILQFDLGLLHTKSIIVDKEFVLFGTLNLDIRSMKLNFEDTLNIYGKEFAHELLKLCNNYSEGSIAVDPRAWEQRPMGHRLLQNALQIISPLL